MGKHPQDCIAIPEKVSIKEPLSDYSLLIAWNKKDLIEENRSQLLMKSWWVCCQMYLPSMKVVWFVATSSLATSYLQGFLLVELEIRFMQAISWKSDISSVVATLDNNQGEKGVVCSCDEQVSLKELSGTCHHHQSKLQKPWEIGKFSLMKEKRTLLTLYSVSLWTNQSFISSVTILEKITRGSIEKLPYKRHWSENTFLL